jgi:hypothetical protein
VTSDRWRQSPDVQRAYDSLLSYLVTTETLRRQARAEVAMIDARLAQSAGSLESLLAEAEWIVRRRNAEHLIAEAETRRQETEPLLQRFVDMHSADPSIFSEQAMAEWASSHLDGDQLAVWEHWNVNQDLPDLQG